MNKLLKTIFTPNFLGWKNAGLIFLITVFSAGFLFISLAQAEAQDLIVEPQETPLFYETNFTPGDNITRWIKVTNNSGQPQIIAIKAINYPNPVLDYDLSRALMITIREKNGSDLYGGESQTGPKTLFNFYEADAIHLSTIGADAMTTYEIEITFPSEKGNDWQEKTTNFDILIGFDVPGPVPEPAVPVVVIGAGGAF